MRTRGVRRIPVVDDEGALAGIFALDDVLELLAEQIGELVKLIQCEQKQEQEARV